MCIGQKLTDTIYSISTFSISLKGYLIVTINTKITNITMPIEYNIKPIDVYDLQINCEAEKRYRTWTKSNLTTIIRFGLTNKQELIKGTILHFDTKNNLLYFCSLPLYVTGCMGCALGCWVKKDRSRLHFRFFMCLCMLIKADDGSHFLMKLIFWHNQLCDKFTRFSENTTTLHSRGIYGSTLASISQIYMIYQLLP